MAEHFQSTVDSLFKGMESFVTTRTCVGEPIHIGQTIILPLVEVSFGIMASARNEEKKSVGGGGMGGKMTPSALLIIKDGSTRLVNIRNQDSISKLIDMVPDLVNKFVSAKRTQTTQQEEEAINDAARKEENF